MFSASESVKKHWIRGNGLGWYGLHLDIPMVDGCDLKAEALVVPCMSCQRELNRSI